MSYSQFRMLSATGENATKLRQMFTPETNDVQFVESEMWTQNNADKIIVCDWPASQYGVESLSQTLHVWPLGHRWSCTVRTRAIE